MKHLTFGILLCFTIFCCSDSKDGIDETRPQPEAIFYKGMDLSFQSELEEYTVEYKDADGNPVDLLDFVVDNGTNLIRLKLWHTPQNGQNSLVDVKTYALRIKEKNIHFLLDFHYSDFWADPGSQSPPVAWQSMTDQEIRVAIYEYTKAVVQQLKDQNTLPKIIQIGNETDSGFLWNYGRVWGDYSNNWSNYADLVSEAIRAVREVDANDSIKIMLHHSSVENSIYFFNELHPFNLNFDIIGVSYYPQFQTKNLNVVQSKMNALATTFDKEILLVEVAYPFTLQWNDDSSNYIGDRSQILNEFPATAQGQKDYMNWLVSITKAVPNNKGVGFCYWAPDWVAFEGNEATSTGGSSWENQCMFDFQHRALPIFEVFKQN